MPKRKLFPAKGVPKHLKPTVAPCQQFWDLCVERWPSLLVVPGGEELDDPDSPLSVLRKSCVLTASMAGLLWNCKRGTSVSKAVKELRGEVPPTPVSEWGQRLMQLGREAEPKIWKTFSDCMAAEFRRLGGDALWGLQPGPLHDPLHRTSATPDGLLWWESASGVCCVPVELKFFASKNELPTTLPSDYLAQVLMQMVHFGSKKGLLVGAVRTDNQMQYRVWKIVAKQMDFLDYYDRLKTFTDWVEKGNCPSRAPNEGDLLECLVLGSTEECTDVWSFLLECPEDLVRLEVGSSELALAL